MVSQISNVFYLMRREWHLEHNPFIARVPMNQKKKKKKKPAIEYKYPPGLPNRGYLKRKPISLGHCLSPTSTLIGPVLFSPLPRPACSWGSCGRGWNLYDRARQSRQSVSRGKYPLRERGGWPSPDFNLFFFSFSCCCGFRIWEFSNLDLLLLKYIILCFF